MTSVDRTAYPVFPRLIMARELYTFFSPPEEEMEWVRGLTNTDEHQLAMAVLLKCHQRLSRFPKLAEVPEVIVDHVRRCLGLPETVVAVHASVRSAETHRKLIRRRVGAKYAPGKARKLAEAEMTRAAFVKNHPPT